jgi:hypothetical protein
LKTPGEGTGPTGPTSSDLGWFDNCSLTAEMSDASDPKVGQDQAEERAVEALQAEYRKSLEKLRAILQREVLLKKMWAELDGDAHHFE